MVSWDRERTETLESKEAGQYSKSLDLQTMMPTKLPHELHSTDCNIAVPGTYNNRLRKNWDAQHSFAKTCVFLTSL